MLRIKFGILYLLYSIKYLWYKIFHAQHAEEFLVESAKYPRIALKIIGVPIGYNCRIRNGLIIYNYVQGNLSIGNNVHLGKGVMLDLSDKISIGNNCTISMGSKLLTHINLGDSKLKDVYPAEKKSKVIEDDVYIGAGSTVLHTAEVIRQGSMLAANSLLDKGTKRDGIYAGSPAILKKQNIKSS